MVPMSLYTTNDHFQMKEMGVRLLQLQASYVAVQ